MSKWRSVEDSPLFDENDILVDDLILAVIPLKGFVFVCAVTVSEDLGLLDSTGDDVGYYADDVTHWIPIPGLPE